jgi:hypothetical protein
MTSADEILALYDRINAKATQPTTWLMSPRYVRRWRRTLRKLLRIPRHKRSVIRAYRRAGLPLPLVRYV